MINAPWKMVEGQPLAKNSDFRRQPFYCPHCDTRLVVGNCTVSEDTDSNGHVIRWHYCHSSCGGRFIVTNE